MSNTSPLPASASHDVDAMMSAKLSVPLSRTGQVSRAQVIERAKNSRRRVVAVSAPAGYGKSSLLAEWADGDSRAVAWVSLDAYDDDPAALLTLIATALVGAIGADPRLIGDMAGPGLSLLGRAAPRLASVLRASPVPFALIVDDLHELRSPACHDVLAVLVRAIPEGSVFVAASRHDQPHVPWLRASDGVVELGVRDLALAADGAVQVFAAARVALSPPQAEMIVQRTEGWPVGLQLAALLARDHAGDVASLSGEDRYVADYLYRESLAGFSPEKRTFLCRTAVLDSLSADLCDEVLQQTGSQSMLQDLEAAHAFLLPLDRSRGWYRYHGLFREFLLGELRRNEPEMIDELHARAADWYQARSTAHHAVEHLLQSSDRDRAVRLVARLALPTYESGQVATLQRWLEELGDGAIVGYPPLVVLTCWAAGLTGRSREAERWAALADAASFDGVPSDGSASFESARAMMRAFRCPDGPDRAREDIELALASEPAWSPWRDLALAVAGEVHLIEGNPTAAEERFAEASDIARAADNHEIQVISDAERGLLAMGRGEWGKAGELISRARTTIDEHRLHDYAVAGVAFPAAARLALHLGDRRRAAAELTQAMRVRSVCTFALPLVAVRLRLHTALAYAGLGDAATARHLMREIDDILIHRPRLGTLLDEVARARRLLGALPAEAGSRPPLTPAELRLLPYLQTHLSYADIGARLFVSRNTVSSELSSIYRKLGAATRAEAVERAMAMGLLGG